jgi:hypothetical protein
MTQSEQDIVKDLNWFLSEYDRMIDVILSNLNTLKEELQKKSSKKEKIVANYQDIIKFKIEVVYSLLIKLEELVFSTTFAYYRKYHGSLRGEVSPVEFDDTKREASYIFDSFLAQYKSLLDLSIKFASEFTVADLPNVPKKMDLDSFEKLVNVLTKRYQKKNKSKSAEYYRFLVKSGRFSYLKNILRNFIKEITSLEEIKHYRDYTIHHGYFRHQLKGKAIEGQVHFSYWIPSLIKIGKNYDVSPSSSQRLDHFCRVKLHKLLLLIAEMTDLIYDDNLRQPYIAKLNNFPPELVKDVLLKISRKGFWADRVFFDEKAFEAFLKSEGIDFSELVEDFTYSEIDNEKGKKAKNGLVVEKVYFKPIGPISVFRTRFITNFKERTPAIERIERPTYGITFSNLDLKELVAKNPQLENVLDTLLRAGLVYVIKTKEEIRYGSVRDDLKIVFVSLNNLTDFRWSSIQIPEMTYLTYFRPRTPEETEETRRILGNSTDEYLKKEDEEREEIQKEYAEWKEKPIHYFENTVDVVDKDKNILSRITHREFLKEQKVNFQNWKQNKLVTYLEKSGKVATLIVPLFGQKTMDQKRLEKLVKTCKKYWKGKPKHFLDSEKEWIGKNKKTYDANVKKAKEEFASCIKKYNYLVPVLRLINSDVFA